MPSVYTPLHNAIVPQFLNVYRFYRYSAMHFYTDISVQILQIQRQHFYTDISVYIPQIQRYACLYRYICIDSIDLEICISIQMQNYRVDIEMCTYAQMRTHTNPRIHTVFFNFLILCFTNADTHKPTDTWMDGWNIDMVTNF